MGGYFHMWSVHKNINNKNFYWLLWTGVPIAGICSLFPSRKIFKISFQKHKNLSVLLCFFFPKDKSHFPVLQKAVCWDYQVPPVQLSVPLEGTDGETRCHVISLRRKMEMFDLSQG